MWLNHKGRIFPLCCSSEQTSGFKLGYMVSSKTGVVSTAGTMLMSALSGTMDNSIPYIRFTAPVNQHSAEQLLHVIDAKYRSGATHLHILLSTPGGTVMHGMAIYNFLKGQPIHITMHNFGTVDSIGTYIPKSAILITFHRFFPLANATAYDTLTDFSDG